MSRPLYTSLDAVRAATDHLLTVKAAALDANNVFDILGSGEQRWGLGGATAYDTWMRRASAGVLDVSGLTINGAAVSGGSGSNADKAIKQAVRVASAGSNVTVSGPGATIDGVTMATGDRVLLKDQTTASENGLYVWNGAAAAMTRTTDANTSALFTNGMTVYVSAGTVNANTEWAYTAISSPTIGTTSITFAQTPALAGATVIGSTRLSVAPAAAATPIALGVNDFTQVSIPIKQPCRVAVKVNQTIPPGGTALTLDGVVLANGDRVLLVNQTTASQNGIYVVGGIGTAVTLTRSVDADTSAEFFYGWQVAVIEGSANSGEYTHTTPGTVTLGTTSVTFSQQPSGGILSPGLLMANKDVADYASANGAVPGALIPVFYKINFWGELRPIIHAFGTRVKVVGTATTSLVGVAIYDFNFTAANTLTATLLCSLGTGMDSHTAIGDVQQALAADFTLDFTRWRPYIAFTCTDTVANFPTGSPTAQYKAYRFTSGITNITTWPATFSQATQGFTTVGTAQNLPYVTIQTAYGALMS